MNENINENVVSFPRKTNKRKKKNRINKGEKGSVRRINGKAYVDFLYLGERVRESSGLAWNEKNIEEVRGQLNRIMNKIEAGTFRFADTFPTSKNVGYFRKKEKELLKLKERPDEVLFKPEAVEWLDRHRFLDVTGRTILGYKSQMDNYLIPLLGHLTFGQFNKVVFEDFVGEARKLELKGKPIGNETINKLFIPLKMICTDVAIKYGWGKTYNPFFGWEKLKVDNPIKRIFPFSLTEQGLLLDVLPCHWVPYFRFAFVAGLRPGQQMAIEPDNDIDWENGELHIQRAITMDEEGKRCEGKTKNEYSRRTIKLTGIMLEALKAQKVIHDRVGGKYFFSTENGCGIYYSNLRDYIWIPALEKAGLKKRSLGQTRHTFATVALSFGESPLWIASVMGHCDAEMVIKRYSKFVKNIRGIADGGNVTEVYHKVFAEKDLEEG